MFLAKRLIDILLSLIGLIILVPFLPVIGLLIKLDSKGSVFYLTDRVGKNLKIFKMYKFRTMIDTPVEVGESLSPQYDPRVTTFGRFLRRTKMNELPQFINILKGEMTFVGPRPEAPDLAELYPEAAKKVFSVKPGLVGPSTILGRNEEEFYPPGVDAKKYYIESILPEKVKLDLEYAERPTLLKDLTYILKGVKETLIGVVNKRRITDNRSQIYLLICDLLLIICSYLFSYTVYFWGLGGEAGLIRPLANLPIFVLIRLPCNIYFGLYSSLIRYISYHEILGALKGVTYGSLSLLLIAFVLGLNDYSTLIAVIDWACLILLLSGLRLGLRIYWDKTRRKTEAMEKHRIFIYGAGDAGHVAYRTLVLEKDSPFKVVGFIDDAPDKYGKTLNGLKVLGNRYHIKDLARLYKVEEVFLAEPEVHPDKLAEIVEICQKSNLRCRIFSSIKEFDSMSRPHSLVRDLEFSDILPLQRIHAEYALLKEVLEDKTVLLNGSGGALGLELCRKILQLGCRRLIILDRYESYLNELVAALFNGFPKESIVPILCDTERIDDIEKMFERYRPNLVIHAGMRKYAPFLSVDLSDIGRTNYLRTFNLAKVAVKFQCELFVMISSLKAAEGGTLVTDSLRIAEVALEHFFSDANTRLIIARICDIAENRGGVVSIIEDQIRNRETVILPSAEAQTWLLSKYSAAEFILQTLVETKQNSSEKKVFICDAGSPISLNEVTRKLANLFGLKLGTDLAVRYAAQSDEPVSMSPQQISLLTYPYTLQSTAAEDKSCPKAHHRKAIFKDFVLFANEHLSPEDWRIQTRNLLTLCEPDTFMISRE